MATPEVATYHSAEDLVSWGEWASALLPVAVSAKPDKEVMSPDDEPPMKMATSAPFAKQVKDLREMADGLCEHVIVLAEMVENLAENKSELLAEVASLRSQLLNSKGAQALDMRFRRVERHVGLPEGRLPR